MRIRFIIYVFLSSILTAGAYASIDTADKTFEDFRRQLGQGEPDGVTFGILQQAYKDYVEVFRNSTPGSTPYIQAKEALKEIFPYLRQAAYYYAKENDQDMVLRFASDYIDLSLLPGMGDEQLQATPGYSVLANLAATNIYNRGDYQNALLYFQAYLSSGDVRNREMAFEGLARSYYELRNYDNAIYIATQGISSYPQNWNMLIVGIESCERSGNYEKMEPMLDLALKMQPSHKTLLEYKGKMLEKSRRYKEAAEIFETLRSMNDSSLDYTCHNAFDLYNSGLLLLQENPSSPEGLAMMGKAIPMFETIFANTPYAANVGRALGVCYSLTGEKGKLRDINSALSGLRIAEVREGEIPSPETQYLPSVNLTPLDNAHTGDAAKFFSDVDTDIPTASASRPNTYVVVIANEDYKYFSDVEYAKRDGEYFAEYCRKTLGVPSDNVRERYDATLSEIREPLRYLAEKTKMNPNELDIILYYAGHGLPDVAKGTAHILPTDASGTDFESCIELDRLYSILSDMPAKSVTVFLDACFSGATRGNEMLFKERFVEYEVEDVVTKGDVVVFAATSGNQTAMGYDEQRHGFFTYYLLKNLKESKGDITLGELGERLRKEVDNKAYDKKNKHQTPTMNASPSLGDSWKNRKL
ncbi:MAG: caspase family protein [Muribaculaceae bacterium]|nr:caspase family protein [Muribaculaceae bacterium]